MWQFLSEVKFSALTQVVIFFGLFLILLSYRKDPTVVAARPRLVRLVILALIFLYFLWSQSSLVLPSLRNVNIFGMILINLGMLWQWVNIFLERPYRRALEEFAENPGSPGVGEQVWATGHRFYFSFYLIAALLSGALPWRFLSESAKDGIRHDLADTLSRHGKSRSLVSFGAMLTFVRRRLDSDLLPPEFRESMAALLAQLEQHPWLEEQVNDYLRQVWESPETLTYIT